MRDNVIYRRNVLSDGLSWLPVIPKHLRSTVLKELNDEPSRGNPGALQTYARVKQLIYWPDMYRSVKKYHPVTPANDGKYHPNAQRVSCILRVYHICPFNGLALITSARSLLHPPEIDEPLSLSIMEPIKLSLIVYSVLSL